MTTKVHNRNIAGANIAAVDFGVVADGVTDDTAACMAVVTYAAAESKAILWPDGKILVTDTIVVPFGNSVTMTGTFSEKSTRGTLFISNMLKPVFEAQTSTSFDSMGFWHQGVRSEAGSVAILCKLAANADDMDCSVERCSFREYYTGIDSYGRGLLVQDCNFLWPYEAIIRRWDVPNQDFPTRPNHTDLPFGYRATTIKDNRFHVALDGGTAVVVAEDSGFEFFRGAVLVNNVMDLVGQLFKGAATNSIFSDNVVDINDNASTIKAIIDFTGPSIGNVISGNTFGGKVARGDNVQTVISDRAVAFRDVCESTILADNVFNGFVTAGVFWVGTGFSLESNTVMGNTFIDCGAAMLGSATQQNLKEIGNTYVNCTTTMGLTTIRGEGSYVETERKVYSDISAFKAAFAASGNEYVEIKPANLGVQATVIDTKGYALGLECSSVRPGNTDGSTPIGLQVRPFQQAYLKEGIIAQSPDGNWWRLTPPDLGGAATWVAA